MHQGAPQKNKSSLISALSKVHPKILTFTIQGITSAPSNVAQTHLLKDKICAFPSYTRGTYHSAWSIGGTQRLSDRTKPTCPPTGSCEILRDPVAPETYPLPSQFPVQMAAPLAHFPFLISPPHWRQQILLQAVEYPISVPAPES